MRLSFRGRGQRAPAAGQTLYIARFGNRTRQTGVNDQFMRYLADEIANHKRLEIVDDASQADLVLSGDIVYSDTIPTAFNTAAEPTIYTQTITADASLLDAHDHKVIWSTRGVSSSPQEAPVVGEAVVTTSPYFVQQNLRSRDIASMQDIQVAQTQGASSIQQAMETLAQNLYASMTEGF